MTISHGFWFTKRPRLLSIMYLTTTNIESLTLKIRIGIARCPLKHQQLLVASCIHEYGIRYNHISSQNDRAQLSCGIRTILTDKWNQKVLSENRAAWHCAQLLWASFVSPAAQSAGSRAERSWYKLGCDIHPCMRRREGDRAPLPNAKPCIPAGPDLNTPDRRFHVLEVWLVELAHFPQLFKLWLLLFIIGARI